MLYEITTNKPVKIYGIRFLGTKNKFIYIGKTGQPLETRFLQHIKSSRKYRHSNKQLQGYLNEYPNCCTIVELKKCKQSDIDRWERHFVNKHKSTYLTNIMLKEE